MRPHQIHRRTQEREISDQCQQQSNC
ncbi:unnamed protein product, partial [Allacma fusca]